MDRRVDKEERIMKNRAMSVCLILAAGSMTPVAALAQNVMVGHFPTGWTNTGVPAFDAGSAVQGTSNVPLLGSGITDLDADRAVILNLRHFAREDGNAVRDRFVTVGITTRNTFTLNANADISLPTFFNGRIFFTNNLNNPAAPVNTNFAVSRTEGRVLLEREGAGGSGIFNTVVFDSNTNAGDRLRLGPTTAQATPGGSNVGDFHFYQANNSPFRDGLLNTITYRLTVQLLIDGEADANFARNSANNSQVDNDFASTAARGLVTSIGTRPAGFNSDSRTAVRAIEARNGFGVDGTGVAVGVVEPGRVLSTHEAFASVGKLTQRPLVGGDNTFSEHTTAVASIIAGNDITANDQQKGVAPGATLISSPTFAVGGAAAGINDAVAAGARVVNMSFGGNPPVATFEAIATANTLVTFVKSAGNNSGQNNNPNDPANGANNVTDPGLAYNIIAVGALNRDFTRRADFSSFNNGLAGAPAKPDLVAPGEYVTSAVGADLNAGGLLNDYDNRFTASDYAHRATSGSTSGPVNGTSFAAPHVSGAAALMLNLRDKKQGAGPLDHDVNADDARVVKAILLNSAATGIIKHKDNATAWRQVTTGTVASQNLVVTESLDRELGAGMLNTYDSLFTFNQRETRRADDNTAQNFQIDTQSYQQGVNTVSAPTGLTWDMEQVAKATGAGINNAGTVDYILGSLTPGARFRATVTWFFNTVDNFLPNLEMLLYGEGFSDFNTPGFVPNPNSDQEDILIAQTTQVSGNVKIIDFVIPLNINNNVGQGGHFYLQVANFSNNGGLVSYGIAIAIPVPSAAGVLALAGLFAARRRRA